MLKEFKEEISVLWELHEEDRNRNDRALLGLAQKRTSDTILSFMT
jgi:hypothetical protein